MGNFLGTNQIPLVYLQNSGIGNIVNPYTSLIHPDIYRIPILFLIGWRGLNPEKDEPQHRFQGAITKEILSVLGIPVYEIANEDDIETITSNSIQYIKSVNTSAAILVHPGIFLNSNDKTEELPLNSRFDFIKKIYNSIPSNSIVISTTGKTSRELEQIQKDSKRHNTFLTIGGMGHCSSIALGLNIALPEEKIYCLDGDGSMQMHLGALATIGHVKPKNFNHFLFNNGVHESVGGQVLSNPNLGYEYIAKDCGYENVMRVKNLEELDSVLNSLNDFNGPNLVIIHVAPGSSKSLGRPLGKPEDWKIEFMDKIDQLKNKKS